VDVALPFVTQPASAFFSALPQFVVYLFLLHQPLFFRIHD